MKKISMILILLIAIVLGGCGATPTISYINSSISMEVGEYFAIKEDNILVSNLDGYTLSYSIDDTDIAVVKNNTIRGVSIGKTTLHITASILWTTISTTVEIVVNPITVKANTATFDHSSILLNMQNEYTFNNLSLTSSTGAKVNEVPIITITPKIATYDHITGKFTGISTGECTVNVHFVKCSATFTATIYDHIYVNTLIVNNLVDDTLHIYKGESGKLDYTITPANANTYAFNTDSDIIDINSDGTYTTLDVGVAQVTLTYNTTYKNTVSMTFDICIEDKVDSIAIDILSNPDMQTHDSLYSDVVDQNIAVLEKTYLLKLTTNIPIDTQYLQLPNSIALVSGWTNTDCNYTATITFLDSGEQDTYISYSKTLYGVANTIVSNTYSSTIYSIYELNIEVRYNLLQVNSDGGIYTVYKKPDYIDTLHNAMTYIDFVAYLDTDKMLPFVDNVTSMVGSNVLTNNLFDSTYYTVNNTPYTIDVYALGVKVSQILVKVLSVDISLHIEYDDTVAYTEHTTTIGVSIVNHYDSYVYSVDTSSISITYDDIYSQYISTTNNIVTFTAYTESVSLHVYYKGIYVDTIHINISSTM